MMKKDLGSVMALYPTPVTLVGTVLEDGRVNWLPIAHVGIVEHHHFVISIDKAHVLSEWAINQNRTVSVSLVNQAMLEKVDYAGIAKAAKEDKGNLFPYHFDEVEKAPIPDEAPLTMTGHVVYDFSIGNFHNFVIKPDHTYIAEELLNDKGKVDYTVMNPVLFEFQNTQYVATGPVIGRCWNYGAHYKKKE